MTSRLCPRCGQTNAGVRWHPNAGGTFHLQAGCAAHGPIPGAWIEQSPANVAAAGPRPAARPPEIDAQGRLF